MRLTNKLREKIVQVYNEGELSYPFTSNGQANRFRDLFSDFVVENQYKIYDYIVRRKFGELTDAYLQVIQLNANYKFVLPKVSSLCKLSLGPNTISYGMTLAAIRKLNRFVLLENYDQINTLTLEESYSLGFQHKLKSQTLTMIMLEPYSTVEEVLKFHPQLKETFETVLGVRL
jgi:hypothetical protein